MSQKSSDPQAISFVSQPLKRDTRIVMREAFGFHVLEEDWCEIEKRYAQFRPRPAVPSTM